MTTDTQQLKIAFSSTDGITVDGHFGSCEQFYIYSIDADKYQKIDVRQAQSGKDLDKIALKAELIADCHLLFCASIGGPPAARVTRSGIHPIKCKAVNDIFPEITEQLDLLQQRLRSGALPPWLAKIMGQANTLNERFSTSD